MKGKKGTKKDLGPTGRFPNGKCSAQDEGELQFGIANENGKVIIHFGTNVEMLGMEPPQAAQFAMLLFKHARQAAKVTGDVIEFQF